MLAALAAASLLTACVIVDDGVYYEPAPDVVVVAERPITVVQRPRRIRVINADHRRRRVIEPTRRPRRSQILVRRSNPPVVAHKTRRAPKRLIIPEDDNDVLVKRGKIHVVTTTGRVSQPRR